MKQKTNSGAKKRFKRLASGKVKRKQSRRRHLLRKRNHKNKRHLAKTAYVNDSNAYQMERLLALT